MPFRISSSHSPHPIFIPLPFSLSNTRFFFFFPSLPLLRLLIYHQPVAFSGFIYSFPLKHPFHFCFLPFPSFISLSQLLIYREPYAFSSNSFSPHLILSYRPFNCHTLQPIRVIYMDF